jgi:hypothetical protein
LLVNCQAEKCLCSKVADELPASTKYMFGAKTGQYLKLKILSYKNTYGYKVIPVWFQQNFAAREN